MCLPDSEQPALEPVDMVWQVSPSHWAILGFVLLMALNADVEEACGRIAFVVVPFMQMDFLLGDASPLPVLGGASFGACGRLIFITLLCGVIQAKT